MQLTLNEIEDKSSTISAESSPKHDSHKFSTFLVFIDCPKDRVPDCGRVIEAIGLKGGKSPIQIITDQSMIDKNFLPVGTIVSNFETID